MNFGSIFAQLFKNDGKGDQGQAGAGSAMGDALARQFFDANQGGATDGSGLLDMARMWDSSRSQPAASAQPAPAGQAAPAGVSPTTMQLLAPPKVSAINITPSKGSDPKKFVPAKVGMTVAAPTALAALGLTPQTYSPFQLTLPQGTKPKNYEPAQLTMNAPSAVGLDNMMQVLSMLSQNSPFGTNGRG